MFRGATPALANIARSILTDSHIFNLPKPIGENSSYQLQFWAPQFVCNSSTFKDSMELEYVITDLETTLNAVVYEVHWENSELFVKKNQILGYYRQYHYKNETTTSNNANKIYRAVVKTERMDCKTYSMAYDLHVNYPKGVQQISYSISDSKPLVYSEEKLSPEYRWLGNPWPWNSSQGDIASYPHKLQEWINNTIDSLPVSNQATLLDALGLIIEYKFKETRYGICENKECWEFTNLTLQRGYADWNGPEFATSELVGEVGKSKHTHTFKITIPNANDQISSKWLDGHHLRYKSQKL